MDGLSWGGLGSGRWRWGCTDRVSFSIETLVGAEPIGNAPFLQIVGCHFDSHFVAGQNAYAVDAHAAGQMAKELVIFGLGTQDFNSERGIWEGLFHNADEFDNILGHKGKIRETNRKSRGILQSG